MSSVNEKYSNVKKVYTEIIAWMFATPAALSILSKIDERLDLAKPLERIIIHFRVVTEAVWNYLFNIFNLNLSNVTDLLSFTLFLSLLVSMQNIFERLGVRESTSDLAERLVNEECMEDSRSERAKHELKILLYQWRIAMLFLLFVAYVFRLLSIALVVLFLFYLLRRFSKVLSSYMRRWFPELNAVPFGHPIGLGPWIEPLIVLSIALISSYIASRALLSTSQYFSGEIAVLTIFLVLGWPLLYLTLTRAYPAIARIGLWVFGILVISFVATDAIPLLNRFLDYAIENA